MNEYNQEQIATEIAELLNSDHFLDALMGKTGGAQSGGSLVVRSNGRQVTAIAVGEVPPGDCVALRDTNTGQWYAVSSYDEGKNDDHLIRYRRWRQPDDNDIVLPVKTIFAIYSKATDTTTFYLGGDRTSEKIDEVKNIRFDNAHIRNLGRNKFFAYSMYVDSADIFRLKINKDSTSNSVDYDYEWDGDGLDIYTGISLDTTSDQFPVRNVYLKDQEIKVRSLTLMTETEIKREDGSVLATDYSYEIETVRNNGAISINTFEIEATLISSEKFTPFKTIDYSPITHSVGSYEGTYGFMKPKSYGGHNITRVGTVSIIGEQKPYAYQYQHTMNVAYWRDGSVGFSITEGPTYGKYIVEWAKKSYITMGVPPNQSFGVDSFWDYSIFDINNMSYSPTADNPSSATAITSYLAGSPVYPYDNPSFAHSANEISSPVTLPNNQIIENISFGGMYPDYLKNKRKKDLDDSLINYSTTESYANGTSTFTRNESITWAGNVFTKTSVYHLQENFVNQFGDDTGFAYGDSTTTETCIIEEGDPKYLDYIKKTCKVKGINTIFNCVNGEIIQDFEGGVEQYGGWQFGGEGTKDPYIGERVFVSISNFYAKKEMKNEIKLIYDNKEITLNNGDFGLLDLKNDSTVVVSSINKETTVFTITYTNTALRLVKNINYADFTGNVFNGNFIMAWEINGKPCLIKGTCTNTYNSQSQVLKISCTVENIKVNTPSSFPKTFIIDNGSYYAYCFRKNTNIYTTLSYGKNSDSTEISGVYFPRYGDTQEKFSEILSKEILNFISLSHHILYLLFDHSSSHDWKLHRILGAYDNLNSHLNIHTTDNIIRNKIYSVAKTDKNKAWVEQWDILENGNVKYKKVFQVDYVPLEKPKQGEELTIFAHSYYSE